MNDDKNASAQAPDGIKAQEREDGQRSNSALPSYMIAGDEHSPQSAEESAAASAAGQPDERASDGTRGALAMPAADADAPLPDESALGGTATPTQPEEISLSAAGASETEPTEARPEASESRPETSEAEAEESEVQAEPSGVQPESSESRPEPSEAQAGPPLAGGRLESPSWSYAPGQAAAQTAQTPAPEASRKSGKGFFRKKSAPAPKAEKPRPPLFQESFAATHPVLSVERSLPPGASSRIFGALALFPLLPLTLMLLLQTVFSLDARALWFPEEVFQAEALRSLLGSGGPLIEIDGYGLLLTPLYTWFLRVLALLIPSTGPMLHFIAAALAALLFLWAALGLGRLAVRVDGRGNLAAGIILLGSAAMTGLIHYSSGILLFAALVTASHIFLYRALVCRGPKPGALVLSFILAALAALVLGPVGLLLPFVSALIFTLWRATKQQYLCVILSSAALAWGLFAALAALPLAQQLNLLPPEAATLPGLWLALLLGLPALLLLLLAGLSKSLRLAGAFALLLLGVAFVLAGGLPGYGLPLVLTTPLLALMLFIAWQITPQRLFRTDSFTALAVLLLAACAYRAAISAFGPGAPADLTALPTMEMLTRLAPGLQQGAAPGCLLFTLLFFLPWTLILFCLPWQRLLSKSVLEAVSASRRPEKEGLAFLWCMLLAALLLALALHDDAPAMFMAALPPLSLLCGRALLGLAGRGAWLFRYGLAILCLAGGLAVFIVSLMLFDVLPTPDFLGIPPWLLPAHGGFFIVGGILLVIGALIWVGLSDSRPEAVLLLAALGTTALGFPLGGLVMPVFDQALSPRDQALTMRAYAAKGYDLYSLDTPAFYYSFYVGGKVAQVDAAKVAALAGDKKRPVVLAAPVQAWEALEDKAACLEEVNRQWLGRREMVLLACPPITDLAPADLPYKEGPNLLEEARKRLDLPLPGSGDDAATPEETQSPAEAPAEQPEAAPADEAAPAETPAEAPADEAAAQPEAAPADEAAPAETPAEAPAEQPEAAPAETPAEAPADEAAAQPEAAPADEAAPAETPAESPADEATAQPEAAPADEAAPAETPAEAPADEATAQPEAAPAAAPVEAPAEAPAESPTETAEPSSSGE